MEYSMFHFADNAWLWGLLAIPAVAVAYVLLYRPPAFLSKLEQFADKHLLPHLLTGRDGSTRPVWRSLLLWSFLWGCGILAMAGPRWNYTDMQTFKPEQNLVVLLDLSKSMDAQDVRPSRMAEAREKVNDLLKMAPGMNIGLIGYAADAHMISPITDDIKPILDFLPELDTSLPYVQGNNLKPALQMASHMLGAEPGNNKSILIISDGGFRDSDIKGMVDESASKDTAVYTIGIGTEQGAPIPADGGGWIKWPDGKVVISRLQADRLQALSRERGGLYMDANYTDRDIRAILHQINSKDKGGQATGKTARAWQEHFYPLVMVMALLILPWFRRGYAFPVMAALLVIPPSGAHAAGWQELFLNKAQQAQVIYNKGDYNDAARKFDTPYRRGVAEYKAKEFANAEKSFAKADATVPAAQYNMGNTQVMQGKYEDAIASYESVLKRNPHNANASHNLDITRKLLQLQKQQQQNEKKESNQQQKDQKPSSGQQQKQEGKGSKGSASNKEGGKQKQSDGQQKSGQGKEQTSPQHPEQNAQRQPQNQNGTQENQGQSKPQNAAQIQSEGKEKQQPRAGQQSKQTNAGAQNIDRAGLKEKPAAETGTITAAVERPRTQKDIDADQWLNRIENDPQSFLRNQFLVETETNGTKQGEEPW